MKQFLQKLVQSDSTRQIGELGVSRVIQAEFQRYGIDCTLNLWDTKRANCTAHIKSSGQKKGLLFVCHHDVVEPGEATWDFPPFSGMEADGKIHGRGSTDMKGGIAALVTAIGHIKTQGLALQGDIVFTATAGEETDSCGVERFVANSSWLPDLAGIVIPEPTGFAVVTAHRGLLWLQIATYGKTAHGSTPHLGVNAIQSIKALLNALDHLDLRVDPHPKLGQTSLSTNTIHGGNALNVVPDYCALGVDIRTLPGQSHAAVARQVKGLLRDLSQRNPDFRADVSLVRSVEALETDAQSHFVQTFCSAVDNQELDAVGFTTDGPSLVPLGVPIIIFGPGDGSVCHQPNEMIRISDVERGAAYYERILKTFLL